MAESSQGSQTPWESRKKPSHPSRGARTPAQRSGGIIRGARPNFTPANDMAGVYVAIPPGQRGEDEGDERVGRRVTAAGYFGTQQSRRRSTSASEETSPEQPGEVSWSLGRRSM